MSLTLFVYLQESDASGHRTGESPSPVASSSGVVPSNRSVTKIRLVNDRKYDYIFVYHKCRLMSVYMIGTRYVYSAEKTSMVHMFVLLVATSGIGRVPSTCFALPLQMNHFFLRGAASKPSCWPMSSITLVQSSVLNSPENPLNLAPWIASIVIGQLVPHFLVQQLPVRLFTRASNVLRRLADTARSQLTLHAPAPWTMLLSLPWQTRKAGSVVLDVDASWSLFRDATT